MSGKYVAGIDTGTASTRGVLIDENFNIAAEYSVPHTMENPQPGFFEMDAEEVWWKDFCAVSRGLLETSGIAKEQIKAVGISVLGCDLVPVDEEGRALAKAALYGIDARAVREIEELHAFYGEEEETIVGHTLCTSDIAPKILWLKNNMPEIHEKAYKLLTGSSYICGKLTGNYVIDPYLAEDFMPLYRLKDYNRDITECVGAVQAGVGCAEGVQTGGKCVETVQTGVGSRRFGALAKSYIAEEYCENFCRPSQLADLLPATEIAGQLTEAAAEATGFAAGTPVLCGTGDSGAEAIGSGVLDAGDMLVQIGSTCYFICLSDKEVHDSRVWPGTFIIPGKWAVCGGTNTAGTLTEWFRRNIFESEGCKSVGQTEESAPQVRFEDMAESIRNIPAGSEGLLFLPYPEGERTPINDPMASGMMLGLTLKHTKAHMYKAALEGIAMEIADHVDIMEENGIKVQRLIASGGGTKNKEWLQIIADCTGREVQVGAVNAGASYGDALMAAVQAGFASDLGEIGRKLRPSAVYTPNPENQTLYAERRNLFHMAYEKNKELMHILRS